MKTFSDFISLKENGILDVDKADETGDDSGIMRALSHAADKHHSEVVSFLQRLAKQDPDIQLELDKINHKNAGPKHHKRKPRMGTSLGAGFDNGDGDVVVPNSADSASGEMPNS
jgi:hypothetical protein